MHRRWLGFFICECVVVFRRQIGSYAASYLFEDNALIVNCAPQRITIWVVRRDVLASWTIVYQVFALQFPAFSRSQAPMQMGFPRGEAQCFKQSFGCYQ
tara:strand:- start:2793 stop:3089 length:297 start_codon:yes stop_codon:yes gene_type:complete